MLWAHVLSYTKQWVRHIFLSRAAVLKCTHYCSVVWQECSKVQQGKIEQIQNYSMRQILSMPPRTPSELLRGILGWDQLAKRRSMLQLRLMHRCMHGLAPEYLCSRFQLNSSLPNYARTRGWNNIHLHRPSTNWYKKSFEFMTGTPFQAILRALLPNIPLELVLSQFCNIPTFVFCFLFLVFVHTVNAI